MTVYVVYDKQSGKIAAFDKLSKAYKFTAENCLFEATIYRLIVR